MSEPVEPAEKPPKFSLDRENIRGLFTLGLLAIVATVRAQFQSTAITWAVNGKSYDVTIFFDVMIILWAFYAFFMVLGLSDDIIGEKAAKLLRRNSRFYLYFSYFLLGYLAIMFYYSIYPLQAIGLALFAASLLTYWLFKGLWAVHKKISKQTKPRLPFRKRLIVYLKSEWYQFLGSIALTCLMLVVGGTHNELVIPSSIIGSFFMFAFLVMRDKRKAKLSSSNEKTKEQRK